MIRANAPSSETADSEPEAQKETPENAPVLAPWFAVRTRSRAEKTVRDYLALRSVDVFLPTITRWSRWKDRKKSIDWPLFPGYCFVRVGEADELTILKCPRVVDIISFGGHRMPIPEPEIEALRLLVGSTLKYDSVPLIKEGMMVEVIHGPLRGVTGRLLRKGDRARLILAVDSIARAVSIDVDAADVKAL